MRCARLTFYGGHDWLFIYGKIEETIGQTASDNALKMNCKNQTVFIGDNLPILRGLNSEIADLIATDPPWNKEKRFNHVFGTNPKDRKGKTKPGFDDAWTLDDVKKEEHELLNSQHPDIYHLCTLARKMHSEGMMAYLVMMSSRMLECHRILKETGTLYFHCDHTANAYIRMLLDAIFGKENFRNQIVWKRTISDQKGSQYAPKQWGNNTDHILFYSKSDKYTLKPYRPLNAEEIEAKFNKTDKDGRKYRDDSSSLFRAKSMGPRPNLCYEWKGFRNPSPAGWRLCKERLEEEFQKGNIVIREDGKLERRQYLEDYPGYKPGNLWYDIPPVLGNEKSGWATQKPVALYSRFILASSNEGDLVLDPFCGCSTTLVAAEKAGREWIGIDRDENAETMVLGQLGKLATSQTPEFWRKRVIIRKCFDQHNGWPVRDDLGKIPNYKKHFDKLYREQSGICPGCNWYRDAHVMTVDHDWPRSKGGRDNIGNLRVLCLGCNSAKGTKTLAQLIARNKKKGIWNYGLYGRETPIDATNRK